MLPAKLKKGDIIGIVAPSKPLSEVKKEELRNFEKAMESFGIDVLYSDNLFSNDKYGCSAGTAKERADDINKFFKDPLIKAIWCFQGGDTANQILDLLDYDMIMRNPKILLGKSDIDLLLMAIYKMTRLISFHAPDSKIGKGIEFDYEYSQKWFKKRLIEGETGEIEPVSEWKCIREGKGVGKIMGCNLSSILKLAGTKYFPDFKNSILFLESYTSDIRTTIYRLEQLKQIGVFDDVHGIVIGHVYGFENEDELKINPKLDVDGNRVLFEALVDEATKGYDFPILKINEFGHYYPNAIIPIGCNVEVDSKSKSINIIENCVE